MPGGRPATIVTQRDVEQFYTAKTVRDVFDDSRVGRADSERLETALRAATDVVMGMELGAFTLEQMTSLAANDYHARMLCCQIVMGIGAMGRPGQLAEQGTNPHIALMEKAEKKLEAIVKAKAAARFAAEEQVGPNRKLGVSNRPASRSFFAGTTDNREPGGY